jgi:prepilin-type processing-associated H-X9-DG protein
MDSLEPRRLLAAVAPVVPLRVNAGGDWYTDSLARTFQPDSGFHGGAAHADTGYDVLGTSDDPIFLSYRTGKDFTFTAPVPDGHYSIWLEFSEPEDGELPGERVFSVSRGSEVLLTDFDIVQSAGAAHTAIAKNFDLTITGGSLDLSFDASVGEALVNAIVLAPTDPPPEAAAYSWEGMSDAARMVVDQSHLRMIGGGIYLYSDDHRGAFPPDLATMAAYLNWISLDTFISPRANSAAPRAVASSLERVAWVDSHHDYVYRGAGNRSNDSPDYVLAYDNPERMFGDINVLFGDGHIAELDRSDAAQLIGFPDAPPTDPPPPPPTLSARDPAILKSQSRLGLISNKLLEFSNDNRGRFPVDLGQLATIFHLPATDFLNPRSTTTVPANNWTDQEKADWINANSDYAYLSNGQRTTLFGADDPVVYEKSAGMSGGINLLFGDGHVEFREFRWADQTLAPGIAPSVRDASFDVGTHGAQSLSFVLTEDVADSLPSLTLMDPSGGAVAGLPQLTYDRAAHTATFTFPPLDAGRYHAVLATPGTADFDYDFVYVPAGGRLALPPAQDFIFQSINLGAGATLDLADSSVLLDYFNVRGDADPEPLIRGLLHSGYASGDWSGTGLATSAAALGDNGSIGYASSRDLMLNRFAGRRVDATAILVKYTYAGDANLDGKINIDDYGRIDAHVGQSGLVFGWYNGDFNFNGKINIDDYGIIDSVIGAQGPVV